MNKNLASMGLAAYDSCSVDTVETTHDFSDIDLFVDANVK